MGCTAAVGLAQSAPLAFAPAGECAGGSETGAPLAFAPDGESAGGSDTGATRGARPHWLVGLIILASRGASPPLPRALASPVT